MPFINQLPDQHMIAQSNCDIENINQAFEMLKEAEKTKDKNALMKYIRALVKDANKSDFRTWAHTFKPITWKAIWNVK